MTVWYRVEVNGDTAYMAKIPSFEEARHVAETLIRRGWFWQGTTNIETDLTEWNTVQVYPEMVSIVEYDDEAEKA